MERLKFVDVRSEEASESFCQVVFEGLSRMPKQLPPRFFYDREGSDLFELITDLPEYYPTRTEQALLEAKAADILTQIGPGMTMIEFGSGSSRKTRILIEAALAREGTLHYVPIDISREFLRDCADTLLNDYPGMRITALAGEYFDAANALPCSDGPCLILFLGSNIGNLSHAEAGEFLARIRRGMRPQDRILVGVDQVKDVAVLEAAYNDAQGVTARFNLNLLARINRELDGHFDLSTFHHHAPYDAEKQRIEMRLISDRDQPVRVDYLETDFCFSEGEAIVTEYCQKYTAESFAALCEPVGLCVAAAWTDPNSWFTEYLLAPDL